MTTGEIIQNKRKQSGWSQDQLAEKLDISRQSISKWEQDLALPDLENGLKLCEVLGITVEELLHPASDQADKPTIQENSFQSAEKFIRKIWHFSGLYIAFVGLAFSTAGFLFKLISEAMSKQFQNNVDGMLGGVPGTFPSFGTTSFLSPFLNFFIGAGLFIMMIGLGIYAYGRFQKQRTH